MSLKKNFVVLTLLSCFVVTENAVAQRNQVKLAIEQPPSGALTTEQLASVAEDIRRLEQNPLALDAKESHRKLFVWIQGSPDVTIKICAGFVAPLIESNSKYHAELFGQFLLSSAAYVIENPEDASDAKLINLGGLEGAFRAYNILKEAEGKSARDRYLEKLLKQKEKGKLESYVAKEIKDC